MYLPKAAMSRCRLEPLESQRKSVAVRAVLDAVRQMNRSPPQPLESFKHRAVVLPEQAFRYMEPVVGVDPYKVSVKRRMMHFRERKAVRNTRLAKSLILVRDDVRRIEQQWLRQARQGAAAIVGGNDSFAE